MQGQVPPQTGQGYPQTGLSHGYPPVGQVVTVQTLPPPTIVIAQPPRLNKVESYNCQLAVKLGVCQIVLGSLIIIFNIAAFVLHSPTTNVIFYGVIIILAGSFEVASGKNNTRCWVITTMVFAILAAIFAASATISPAIALGLNSIDSFYYGEPGWYHDARYAINACIVVCAIVEFVIAIIAGVLTCQGVCCNSTPIGQRPGMVIAPPPQYGQPTNQAGYPAQQAMAPAPPGYTYQQYPAPPAYEAAQPQAPEPTEEQKKAMH